MSTLLLRLAGPMQSWGTDSQYDVRFTGGEPSKSGVIGLLCAALGKPREEGADDGLPSLAQLAALQMGVRVDRAGTVQRDYQTVGGKHRLGERYGVATADGALGGTVVSPRYYLADADFLVGLEGQDTELLERLDAALARPVWQLCLGRKAFVPGEPVRMPDPPPLGPGLRDATLEDALRDYPWRDGGRREPAPEQLRLVLEAAPGTATEVRQDVPLSFSERRFTTRHVRAELIPRPGGEV